MSFRKGVAFFCILVSAPIFGFKNVNREALEKWVARHGVGTVMQGVAYDEQPCSLAVARSENTGEFKIKLKINGYLGGETPIEIEEELMRFNRIRDLATGQRYLKWNKNRFVSVRLWLDLENEIKSVTFNSSTGEFIDGCYGPFTSVAVP